MLLCVSFHFNYTEKASTSKLTTPIHITDKPDVSVETTYITVIEDRDIILRCTVEANPPAHKLYWLHKGEVVKTATNQDLQNTTKKFELVISNVKR